MACLRRIETFLKSDARRDHRLPLNVPADVDRIQESPPSDSDVEMVNVAPNQVDPQLQQSPILVAQNASFGWNLNELPTVSDVSFTLPRHQVCFVIGTIGSGKSTLLKGLLGETPSTQGFVYSSFPSSAFVDQTPWIQNCSIQQNILGISNFEESWYSQVVHACALEYDISKLPKGHGEFVNYVTRSML